MGQRMSLCRSVFLVTTLVRPASLAAETLIVDIGGAGDFTEIQSAIDASSDGDTVLVKPGEYVIEAPISFEGKKIAVKSEVGAERTTIHMSETPADPERASVVIFESGETAASVLEGFTVTGGKDSGLRCIAGSSPIIKGCTFSDNLGFRGGGVLCDDGCSASFVDCRIAGNTARCGGGGGVSCLGATATFTRCKIIGNMGIVMFDKCYTRGGGILCEGGSPAFTDCIVAGNSAHDGGGVLCTNSSPAFMRCAITGNLAQCWAGDDFGGGLAIHGSSSPTFTDCTIARNRAVRGGGVYCAGDLALASPVFTRCTIARNIADLGAGALFANDAMSTIQSCILWGNAGESLWAGQVVEVTFSCVEGDEVWPGEGNIDADPLFCGWDSSDVYVDAARPGPGDGTQASPFADIAAAFDFRLSLSRGSPCLGRGAGGADMGADLGVCELPGPAVRRIHVARGTYRVDVPADPTCPFPLFEKWVPPVLGNTGSMNYVGGLEILGAGLSETVLDGTPGSLRCWGHAALADLTLRSSLNFCSARGRLERAQVTEGVGCSGGSDCEITGCLLLGHFDWEWVPLRVGDASVVLRESTICESGQYGIHVGEGGEVKVTDSIIWGNREGAILREGSGAADVRSSCTQDFEEGEGNFVGDPLFCGRSGAPEVAVGTQEELDAALAASSEGYSYALALDSPCLHAGSGGGRIGADLGTCPTGGARRIVRLAAGTYAGRALRGVKLIGAGWGKTLLETGLPIESGMPLELCDAALADLTVKGALELLGASGLEGVAVAGSIACKWGSASRIEDSFISVNFGADPFLADASAVAVRESAALAISGSTIVGARRFGIELEPGAAAEVTGSIVWRNLAGGIHLAEGAKATVRFSCVQGDTPWPGEGNLSSDPRFCGWSGPEDSAVTAVSGLLEALDDEFDYALAADSPCLRAGPGGSCMGAETGLCGAARPERTVRLAAGVYEMENLTIGPGMTLRGASRAETIIAATYLLELRGGVLEDAAVEGPLRLEGEARIARGTVRCSYGSGITCGADSRPRIEDSLVTRNRRSGVHCEGRAAPEIDRCTIALNGSRGLALDHGVLLKVRDSIVWGNPLGPLSAGEAAMPEVDYSCLDSANPWPGSGNINRDPLFCGWQGDAGPVVVKNEDELAAAIEAIAAQEFSHALASGSPCRGAGSGGWDMGASLGRCDAAGLQRRSVLLVAGTYAAARIGSEFPLPVDIQGAGRDLTVLEGDLEGLRSSMALSRVTILGRLKVKEEQAPEIREATIARSSGGGSGVSCEYGSAPTFRDCTVSEHLGRGVWCNVASRPTFVSCRIAKNLGGGVRCQMRSAPLFEDSVIAGNAAHPGGFWWEQLGGGVLVGRDSNARFSRCTISGNWAYEGGGVYCDNSSPILTNCTISGNLAARDGGVCCYIGSSPTLTNCIVWGNAPESVCGTLSHCLTDQNPLFVDPGHWDDNGTPENSTDDRWIPGDYHLQPGSPAIDAGTSNGAPTTDIEGRGCPCGAGVDIGAYEFGDCAGRFRRGDADASGALDLTDAIVLLGHLFLGGGPPKCRDAADADDSGTLDITDAIYSLSFLFLGGSAPPAPFPDCGIDPTIDGLDCRRFSPCE